MDIRSAISRMYLSVIYDEPHVDIWQSGRKKRIEKNDVKNFKKCLTNDSKVCKIARVLSIQHTNEWDLSSAGRASALQAEGHRFEPYRSHFYGGIAQLARAHGSYPWCRGFKSPFRYFFICFFSNNFLRCLCASFFIPGIFCRNEMTFFVFSRRMRIFPVDSDIKM